MTRAGRGRRRCDRRSARACGSSARRRRRRPWRPAACAGAGGAAGCGRCGKGPRCTRWGRCGTGGQGRRGWRLVGSCRGLGARIPGWRGGGGKGRRQRLWRRVLGARGQSRPRGRRQYSWLWVVKALNWSVCGRCRGCWWTWRERRSAFGWGRWVGASCRTLARWKCWVLARVLVIEVVVAVMSVSSVLKVKVVWCDQVDRGAAFGVLELKLDDWGEPFCWPKASTEAVLPEDFPVQRNSAAVAIARPVQRPFFSFAAGLCPRNLSIEPLSGTSSPS